MHTFQNIAHLLGQFLRISHYAERRWSQTADVFFSFFFTHRRHEILGGFVPGVGTEELPRVQRMGSGGSNNVQTIRILILYVSEIIFFVSGKKNLEESQINIYYIISKIGTAPISDRLSTGIMSITKFLLILKIFNVRI